MANGKIMDVHEALDDIRAQKEILEEELRTKANLCDKLKKSQNELVTKFQEAELQSEKQAQELSAKSEELSTLNQLHQDLKFSSQEKDLSLRHLNSVIEKLRYEYGEKLQKLEGKNKELILSLEKASATSQSLQLKIDRSNMEIEDLKRILLLKDKKILEISDKSETTKDVIQRDELISKLEEKNKDVQCQLKWRNEQFQHLEEAHVRLQDTFQSSKVEWEADKSLLLKEIVSLQTNLDSKTRISENLQAQLRTCNQALAHEESTRKMLEVEVSEYKSRLENVSFEFHEAKKTIQKLCDKRDEEVAKLRDNLAAKDSISKEMAYKIAVLEQENQDFMTSLKEFQESQITNSGNTGSLKKLQKKYQGLEKIHMKCSQNLKEKEAEWKSQIEKGRKEIDGYLSKLKVQSGQVKLLQEELESSHFLSEVHREVMSTLILVLKSEFSELLEVKNKALCEANVNIPKQCLEVASLTEKAKSTEDTKQHQLLLEELRLHKNMLAESSKSQLFLEEQIQLLENSRNQEEKDRYALSQKVVELEKRILVSENQNTQLETSIEACNIENQELISKENEQNEKIIDLQKKVTESKQTIELQNKEIGEYFKIVEDKERISENYWKEKSCLLQAVEEKNSKIEKLMEDSRVFERELKSALTISLQKQIEIDVILQAFHKLDIHVSDLHEKLRVADDLLGINRLETEKVKEEYKYEKTRLESLVKNLEDQNQDLHEDVTKLSSVKEDLLLQMERTTQQIDEYANDAELMGMLENILQKSNVKEDVVNLPCFSLQKGDDVAGDARLPLVDLNK